MAKIEQISTWYEKLTAKVEKHLKDYSLLVPQAKVTGDYYNDKGNFVAKDFYEQEFAFKRKIVNLAGKYKNIHT